MSERITVIQHGIGVVGKTVARIMAKKAEVEIVGAVDIANVGKDLGEVAGLEKLGVTISDNLDAVLAQTKPKVMLDATFSHTKKVFPTFMKALEAGVSVITTGEELFNPWVNEPELARKLDDVAKKHGVAIKGTGLCPGFILDVLPLTFTGVCGEVEKIKVDRCLDSSELAKSPAIRELDGYGLPKEMADKKLATGEITLHVGISEEIGAIADCLGWKLTDIQIEKELLATKVTRDYSPDYKIEPGQVHGYKYNGYGIKDGDTVIELKNTFIIGPSLERDGVEQHYTLWIEGNPPLQVNAPDLTLPQNALIETAASAVNWVPHIIKAKPGLLTNAREFPLVACLP
ncbi:MAG: hypothetical protein ACOC7P_00545 [Chloroflexota bacterium]